MGSGMIVGGMLCIRREMAEEFARMFEGFMKKFVRDFESRIRVGEKYVHLIFYRRVDSSVGGFAQAAVEQMIRGIRGVLEQTGWSVTTRMQDDVLYIVFSYPICGG